MISQTKNTDKLLSSKRLVNIIIIILFGYISVRMAYNINVYGMESTINVFEKYLMINRNFKLVVIYGSICITGYLLLNVNKKVDKAILIALLTGISFLTGLCINPISKGTSVMYEKPLAKEVQSIVKEDKDALWMVNDFFGDTTGNYLAVNGARTLNTTANYPNLELYKELFGDNYKDEDIQYIYNRYAHIYIEIIDGKSSLEYMGADTFKINISIDDISKLEIKYIVSAKELNYKNLEKIYSEYDTYIYKAIK